ncbi:MAG: GAF domain-containing sensor histidine kinase, partial [Myxococcota bacterium]
AKLASEVCGTPIALITFMERERQWFKARVGIKSSEADRRHSFCTHTIARGEAFVVPNALEDHRFRDNPFVVNDPRIRFYAGIPLLSREEGLPIGSLCVIDREPRELSDDRFDMLRRLARHVENTLELRRASVEIRGLCQELETEREARERALSYLAHDMRQPLTLLQAVADTLAVGPDIDPFEAAEDIACATGALDLMLGNLEEVTRSAGGPLKPTLARVNVFDVARRLADETRRLHGDNVRLEVRGSPDEAEAMADAGLISRSLRNLLSNAVRHGKKKDGEPVRIAIAVGADEHGVECTVSDDGPGVAPPMREAIFRQGYTRANSPGQGLGLTFSRLAARAHPGGDLWFEEAEGGGACFRLRLPVPDGAPEPARAAPAVP